MYKLMVRDEKTGTIYYKYGFSGFLLDWIDENATGADNDEVLMCLKLRFSPKTFWKCLKRVRWDRGF